MKQLLLTIVFILAFGGSLNAQLTQPSIPFLGSRSSAPGGVCSAGQVYRNSLTGEYRYCFGGTWHSFGGPGITATPGSVLFGTTGGGIAQSNSQFYFDSTKARLMVQDKTYTNPFIDSTVTNPFSVASNDFDYHNTATSLPVSSHYFNAIFDTKLNASGSDKYYVGQYVNMFAGGSYTGGTVMGQWINVSNEGNEGNTTVDVIGTSVTANGDSDNNSVTGGQFYAIKGNINTSPTYTGLQAWAAGGYSPVTTLTGLEAKAMTNGGVASTVTNAAAIIATVTNHSTNVFTNGKGINLVGWGGNIQNSYGIYADTSIDRGTVSKYFIKSLSTSPSEFAGDVRVRSDYAYLAGSASTAPVAAASTISAKGNIFHVDNSGLGCCTINTIGAATAGAQITIIFDNPGIDLSPTGGNLVLTAPYVSSTHSTISLVYDGANWYETARSQQVRKLVALISQAGTAAPTLNILENTLGGTPVASRLTVGAYRISLAGAFPDLKTAVQAQNPYDGTIEVTISRDDSDNISITTTNNSGTSVDSYLYQATIEIIVYP